MSDISEPSEYVLYIDEAGDDGLKRVKPIDEIGGREWLCIGGLLIRSQYEADTVKWVKDIRKDTRTGREAEGGGSPSILRRSLILPAFLHG